MTASFVLLGTLLILSGFFSGTETAYTSLSPAQIHDLSKRYAKRGLIVQRLMESPERFLTTVLIGNNLVNVAASALATILTIELFGSGYEWLMTAVLTVVLLIFGEVTPKRIAIIKAEPWAIYTARLIQTLAVIFTPIVWFVTSLSNIISRLFAQNEDPEVSEKGIMNVIDHAATVGVIERDQGHMVRGVLRIGAIETRAVMTHRTRVYGIDGSRTVGEALPEILKEGFSRVPVYEEQAERIVGVLLVREAVIAHVAGDHEQTLRTLMKPPLFVPEHKPIDEVLEQLRTELLNMAVVLDEYGGVAGIITIEDIVEEILGEIYDENEQRALAKIHRESETTYTVQADVPTYVLNDALELEIPSDRRAQTLGGFLVTIAGHIPQAGEVISSDFGEFEIIETSATSVQTVRFTPTERETLE